MKIKVVWISAAALLASSAVLAQSSDDLQPRVQTSSALSGDEATAPPSSAKQAPAAPSSPKSATTSAPPRQPAQTQPAAAGARSAADRLELGTSEISGNRELPKLMYIVPWQHAEIGQFAGRPPNSLVDEALAPVDRTVFERQNSYYAALQAGAAASQPSSAGASASRAPAPANAAPATAQSANAAVSNGAAGNAASGKDEK